MNVAEIEKEILKLEGRETTWETCQQLAVLYTVRANLRAPRSARQESEFLDAVSRLPADEVFQVLNEHFDCIKAMFPTIYSQWKDGQITGTTAAKQCNMPLSTFRYRAERYEKTE